MEPFEQFLNKVNQKQNVLTEKELSRAYEILERLGKKYPSGFQIMSELEKIQTGPGPDDFHFEYKLSDEFLELVTELKKAYPDPHVYPGVLSKILVEQMMNSGSPIDPYVLMSLLKN